jgi:hypothetical protein
MKKQPIKKQPIKKQAESYLVTLARSLIGERMLISDIHVMPVTGCASVTDGDCLYVHAQLEDGRRVCFRAGVVVKQQLENQRFFPAWARLNLVQGTKHEYYMLDIAKTIQVRGNLWRLDFDLETQSWKQEPMDV